MPNHCMCTLTVSRRDWWKLSQLERDAFIRKPISKVDWDNYIFSFQYEVPLDNDSPNRWNERIDNRWCKRDAYDVDIVEDEEVIEIDFCSARSPPSVWLRHVSAIYPELKINLSYDEPLCWFQWKMWRDEHWELYDIYREWDEYLQTCSDCWFHKSDAKRREEKQDIICDECLLKHNHNNNEKNW